MADINVNIMMIGGRRCGKTSVLAKMVEVFDKEFGKSNLTIRFGNDNRTVLYDKIDEMNDLYARKGQETRFTPDDEPTKDITPYGIELSLKSKTNGKILYTFIDIPGEMLQGDEHNEELTEIVRSSSVIIVAIDTPFLMEEAPDDTGDTVGLYNEKRNRSGIVCDFLKSLDLNEKGGMVIFVPLKCERYLHDGKMNLVNQRVHTAYRSFFDYIGNDNNRSKCTTVITPIFTFGTVEFTRFKRDGAEIMMDEKYKTPKYPLYQFTDNAGTGPEPKYCEQPLLYVLLYILRCAEVNQRNRHDNFFSHLYYMICENFFKMPSADDFMKEIENIQKAIKINGDGYEIVTDPNGLKGLL